jgi:hypothetical protein
LQAVPRGAIRAVQYFYSDCHVMQAEKANLDLSPTPFIADHHKTNLQRLSMTMYQSEQLQRWGQG